MSSTRVSFHVALAAGETIPSADHGVSVLRPGGMDGWILNYTTVGRGRINRGTTRFTVAPHDVILFKPDVVHDYDQEDADVGGSRWEHLWIYFFPRPHWRPLLAWPEVAPGILRIHLHDEQVRNEVLSAIREVIRFYRSPLHRRDDFGMSVLERILLWCDTANPRSAENQLDPRIQRAMTYLHDHAAAPMRIDRLAHACGLSASRLSHLFKSEIGTTPMQYLEQQRIQRARELLLMSTKPIAEIASDIGMPNPVYFARRFKRLTTLTPREFRRGNQGKT